MNCHFPCLMEIDQANKRTETRKDKRSQLSKNSI